MHLQQTSLNGENYIGLLGIATDRYAVIAEKFREIHVLGVPVMKTKIYGTSLIGMFCAGNSNGLLLPYFIPASETDVLEEFLGEFKTGIGMVMDRCTALGNMIVCNDNGAIVSPMISDTQVIEDTLGVEVVKSRIAGHDEAGACCIATNKGFLLHPAAEEEELEKISGILGVPGMVGSVNFGFPFVKSGLIANSHGYVTGLGTSGVELGRIDEALGFLDK